MIRNILQRIRKSKGGFTLVELMVTMVLVGLLIGASAAGIFYYQKWAVWQRQEHYARTLFLAAQSGMTQYSTDKRLDAFEKEAQTSAQAIVRQNQLLIPITDETGQTVSVSSIWKNDDGQTSSDLYYVTGTPADYQAYKSGNADAAHMLLYDIFDAYLYDKTLLSQGCISVEFDAHDGLVYSVLYSDRADELSYGSCNNKTANIVNRSKENRKGNGSENSTGVCFGYYGADSLSKSDDASSQVKISSVSLNNEETLNLTWKLSDGEMAVSQMNYQVMICDAQTGEELLEISLNNASLSGQKSEEGYYYSIPAESADDALKLVAAQVTSFADGKEKQLGTYPFLAYIDGDLTVTLVLDAVDLDATQAAYETYRRTGEPGNLADTLSLHRFGLEKYGVDEIRCIVQGGGSGYRITGRRQSNSELMYFARQSSKKDSDDSKDENGNDANNKEAADIAENDDATAFNVMEDQSQKAVHTYEIQNARHLYNIRFAEMITDAAVYAADADEKSGNEYQITQDFAWGYDADGDNEDNNNAENNNTDGDNTENTENTVQKLSLEANTSQTENSILAKGQVYRSGLSVHDADTAFPMITQLREGSSLGSVNGDEVHTIDYLTLSDVANEGTGSTNRWYPQGDGTALILENLGTIHDLTLGHVQVSGADYTAAFCAYNGGTLENLETASGTIEADNYASGIFASTLPMKDMENVSMAQLINHASVTAEGAAAGIVADASDTTLHIEDCVNTGLITGGTAAGITTAQSEDLTLVRCQNYAPIQSLDDKESFGITSSSTAVLTDCVGVSDNTYPIAADAQKDENCLYFAPGLTALEKALQGGIADISLTIGEADRDGAYKETAFNGATEEQIKNLIAKSSAVEDASDKSSDDSSNEPLYVPVFAADTFDMKGERCPIYTARFNGTVKLNSVTLGGLGEGTYQFTVLYADAQDGSWKLLAENEQSAGNAATIQAADAVEASALKIIVTDVTEGCAVSLGSIAVTGTWQIEGVGISRFAEAQEDSKQDTSESNTQSQNDNQKDDSQKEDSQQDENQNGIGTVLYVYQDGELTEDDPAELYTKWTVFAGNVSISPLLLNTEEAKADTSDENIRIRVWEKLREELSDLTVFEREEPMPGAPSGIAFTEADDTAEVSWQPGQFANHYEYEVEYYAYEWEADRNSSVDKNPVQESDGSFKVIRLGSESGTTNKTMLELSKEFEGQHVDRIVIHVRSANDQGESEWVTAQTADVRLVLPSLHYHLKLCRIDPSQSSLDENGKDVVWYELVIENEDAYKALAAGRNDVFTVLVSGSAETQFALGEAGRIAVSNEETVTLDCTVSCPGYQTSPSSEKAFSVLSANTVLKNEAVFEAVQKPDQVLSGFQMAEASSYQIAAGRSKKASMQILTSLEAMDEQLLVPVQYQAQTNPCSTDTMELTSFDVTEFWPDDHFTGTAFLAYPIELDNGQVELGHFVGDLWDAESLLKLRVTVDGEVDGGLDGEQASKNDASENNASSVLLIENGAVADGYAILAEENGYRLYYSPLLRNSMLSQYSSSDQSLYGVWRYVLADEESTLMQPVLVSINDATENDSEIDGKDGALIIWDGTDDGPLYEGADYSITVIAVSKNGQESTILQEEKTASEKEESYSGNVSVPEDCVQLIVQVKRSGIVNEQGFTLSRPAEGTLTVRVKEPEKETETEESSPEETTVEETSAEEPTTEETTAEETTAEEPTTEEPTAEETTAQETSAEETTPEETESESESESETETEPETEPEPVPLATPTLSISDESQEFLYPVFDKDENGKWKDSGRKVAALQHSIYFEADATEEGCAGYEVSVLSLPKTTQIGKETLSYRDAFTFQIKKDDSAAGFSISGMLSTKSNGYTMYPKDTESGKLDLYERYTDRENGIYTYLLPYYVECESEQEKVLVYAWLKQTNQTDEDGTLISTRFEVFVPDGAAPLGDPYKAPEDCATISVQAFAEKNQTETYGKERWLDSKVGSLSREHAADPFQKNEAEKEPMEDGFADAVIAESENTEFAYCFAQGAGMREYVLQTQQWRVTKAGEQTCTYRILPVYWKYDDPSKQKQYFVYLPEDGYAVPYYEQVNGNEPYLLYNLSICFAGMDETGLSEWSKLSASAHDGDPKTFVLKNNTGMGHLTAPTITSYLEDRTADYPLLDESGQTVAQIQAKTKALTWSWNSNWDKAAGFETKLTFTDTSGQTKEVLFDWNNEEWLKNPSAWDAAYGSALLDRLTVYEKCEEESTEEASTEASTEETSGEASTEEKTSQETSSQEPPTPSESQTESSESQTAGTETTTPEATTESTTPVPATEPTTQSQAPELSTEMLPETQSLLPEAQETLPEEATAPAENQVGQADQASIQRKKVVLCAMSPFASNVAKNVQNPTAYTFEVAAVLTIQTTVLSDGSTQYQFTLEFPQEILGDEYTDDQSEPLKLMQLENAQTILKLQDADRPYYKEIVLEQ